MLIVSVPTVNAENIAGGVTNNASFNCNANKMLITPRGWALRGQLLGAIAQVFERTPVRAAYYPGAEDRYQALTAARAKLHTIGQAGPGIVLALRLRRSARNLSADHNLG